MYRLFAVNRSGEKKPNYRVLDPEPSSSPDAFVTVAQFTDQITADLHRVHLESEGIEGIVTGTPYSRRQAGYALQVRAEDAPRAVEILNCEMGE